MGVDNGFVFGRRFVKGQALHLVDKIHVCCKHPPQQADEEQEEDHKGYHRPDGDVVDVLKHIFIHIGNSYSVLFHGGLFSFYILAQALQIRNQGYDLRFRSYFDAVGAQ